MKRLLVVFFLAFGTLAGCATARTYGDQEFEKGNYNAALTRYEQAFAEGEKDWRAYHNAAKASLATADFSKAERYYAQAIRLGADIEVARELAAFYVKTSNYVSAVQMYQYLLNYEKDPRPVYTNLGAALMYAGKPLEGESFLLMAQQLDPVAKVPYLNLGILYDQHLRQPQHSLGFYKCFLAYATDEDPNRVKVDQRIRELSAKYPSAANRTIECGKPYSPDLEAKSVNLKAEMEKVEKEYELFEGQAKAEESKEVVIEKMVEEDSPEREKGTSEADRRYLIGDYEEATRIYMDQPVSKLTPLQVRRLAIGLSRLQKHVEAEMWIGMALGQEETPELVRAALVSLKAIEKQDKVDELCQKFKDRAEYKEALEPCNGP